MSLSKAEESSRYRKARVSRLKGALLLTVAPVQILKHLPQNQRQRKTLLDASHSALGRAAGPATAVRQHGSGGTADGPRNHRMGGTV